MKVLSERARKIKPSITLAISVRAKQMKADGVSVLNTSVREPDFDTSDEIKRVAQTEDFEWRANF